MQVVAIVFATGDREMETAISCDGTSHVGSVVPRLSTGIYYKLENVQLRKEEYTRALECANVLAPHIVCYYIPYSLNITTLSIISPPLLFA